MFHLSSQAEAEVAEVDRARTVSKFVLGVDLGQSQDPTALCVIERRAREVVTLGPAGPEDPKWREIGRPEFLVRFLERLQLGWSYPRQVVHVAWLLSRPELQGADLVIDRSGVGRPVSDLFAEAGLRHEAVTITAGTGEGERTEDRRGWTVSKAHLVSLVSARLNDETLGISAELPEADALMAELEDFKINYTATGAMTFSARSGRHDDLLLAMAIGLWWASRPVRRAHFRRAPIVVGSGHGR